MADRLPLPTLLSHALVAFTIELDNEFELQTPHRITATKDRASREVPWLVSLVMWSNFLQFVGDGISIRDLQTSTGLPRQRLRMWLTRLGTWAGYITVDDESIVRFTPGGRKAQEVWQSLFEVIEKRWNKRFGEQTMEKLRDALCPFIEPGLPDYLPIVGYGLFSPSAPGAATRPTSGLPLSALLSKVLLAFALKYEHNWPLSLAMSANVLRVLNMEGVRVRDLPRLTGVSKEAVRMSVGYLEKYGLIHVESSVARLTSKGHKAQAAYRARVAEIENQWQERFGAGAIRNLNSALEPFSGDPLFEGLLPHPSGWRARVPKPDTLPHFPMVLHRGGYPDGS